MSKKTKEKYSDFGLGSRASSGTFRTLNKDGSFNIRKTHLPFFERVNFFHSLITMSWLKFLGIIVLFYFLINLIFASLYLLIGVEHLAGIIAETTFDKFLEAFFFSSQTITTLGYGRISPVGTLANIVAAIESMMGLLGFALATGLLYGRFSKPSAKIIYSKLAVIGPYRDINAFMFRVINPRKNQLLEVEVNVNLSIKRENSDLRDFYSLDLERAKVVFFASTWTIVHPINPESPLYHFTEKTMHEKDVEFIILIRAFDESFSQTVYSRSSYKADEIKWGEKFAYIIQQETNGTSVNVGRINETEDAILNEHN
ncbi:MAG: K+ channel, inward rectifier [Flavobacteriales bacterium]|nr:K+ channel, inward rectifier [Flavobacteriales bacterium]